MAKQRQIDWEALLNGTSSELRRGRALFRIVPSAPRCKLCNAPFAGPGAPLMRAIGRGPWPKNPNYCSVCLRVIEGNHGGAEITASALFADIRGSTTLAERMSPADFSRLLDRFYELAARVVIGHDGIVDKFVGDEVVAFFAQAFSGPNHAERAVSAARELVREAGAGGGRGAGHRGAGDRGAGDRSPIPVGAGVHTGTTFVGAIGEGDVTEFTAVGDAVNTTARLASAAAAGEVLVTKAAAEAAGLAGELEVRHLELRGKTEPVDVVVLRPAGPVPA